MAVESKRYARRLYRTRMCVGRCAPHSAPHGGASTAKTYADGSRVAYDHTADGKRARTTWARGAWRQDAYNARGLVSGTTYSDAATPSVAYGYADSGAVAAATLSDGTSYSYGYDDRLLNTNESVTVGGESFSVNRTHDQFRRASKTAVVVTDVCHAAKVRLYDSEDCVCGYALTNAAGRGVAVTLAYDGSHVTNVAYTLPNGGELAVRLTRERARKELVTRRDCLFGGQPVYWYKTGYDLLGRPTNAVDSASLAREWLYNRRSELAAAIVGTNRYGYAYDSIGNRIRASANAATNSYAANGLNQYASILRASAPPREIVPQYDADGNLTQDDKYSYAYDAENRLVSVTPLAPHQGDLSVLNTYDHRHRRVLKRVNCYDNGEWVSSRVHSFAYDGGNIVLERIVYANGDACTIENFWGDDLSGTEDGAGGVGGLLAVSIDGNYCFPCYDHNGNIVRYVSETGAVAAQFVYDPYGNVLEQEGETADSLRIRFSTKYADSEVGVVSYLMRFYDSSNGRWLTRDPVGEEGGLNLYGFCGNNAVANYDKDGRAYFAIRGLGGGPVIKWSWFFSCPFMKVAVDLAADALNVELVHEQLFFEDGGDLSSIGWGTDGNGNADYLKNESMHGYKKRDGGYDDCIMRIALGKVDPDHYQLTWIGKQSKCNCQDYASALRTKYYELENDPEVKCKCKKRK